jgi:hypothetical protein
MAQDATSSGGLTAATPDGGRSPDLDYSHHARPPRVSRMALGRRRRPRSEGRSIRPVLTGGRFSRGCGVAALILATTVVAGCRDQRHPTSAQDQARLLELQQLGIVNK